MNRYWPFAAVIVIVVAGGALHGVWSDRWEPISHEKRAQAAHLLKEFPTRLGEWESTEQPWSDIDYGQEGDFTTITRRFVNRRTGQAVSTLFASGYPRHMGLFHTPLECYPALGYTLAHPTYLCTIDRGPTAQPGRFLVCDFQKTHGPMTQYVRVLWGYSAWGDWDMPEHPSLRYGAYSVLYKVYATRPMASADEPLEGDPCVAFLRDFMPVSEKYLFGRH